MVRVTVMVTIAGFGAAETVALNARMRASHWALENIVVGGVGGEVVVGMLN